MSNTTFAGAILGLMFGAVLGGLLSWEFTSIWLKGFLALSLCCFLIFPLLWHLIPRWQVVPDGVGEYLQGSRWSREVRKWTRVRTVSGWMMLVVLIAWALSNHLYIGNTKRIIDTFVGGPLTSAQLGVMGKAIEHFRFVLMVRVKMGVLVFAGGLSVAFFAEVKRNRALRALRSEAE